MTHLVTEIVPACLVHAPDEARRAWDDIRDAEWVQIDCLDGQFVPDRSFFDANTWPVTGPSIELHLMCAHPLAVMQAWEHHPLFRRAIWHAEASVDHEALLEWCKNRRIHAGIALNPETSVDTIASLLPKIDSLLLMSVHPGWSGQTFLPTTFAKLEMIHTDYPALRIGIDGGVTEELIPRLEKLGASHLYVGSHIFSQPNTAPAKALHHLQQIAHHASV